MTRPRTELRSCIAAVAVAAVLALLPAAADAAKVSNPGSFNAVVSNGVFRINEETFTFDSSTPITFNGTVASNGTVNVPKDNIHFPTLAASAGGFDLTVYIKPAADMTGTLNPLDGSSALRLRVWIKIDDVPLGGDCRIASESSPLDANMMITGTTSPPSPNTPLTGTPYNSAAGTMKIVNNDFSVPSSSDCGIAASAVNSELGLPAAAGNNEVQFTLQTTPSFQPGLTGTMGASTTSGFAPLPVNFTASAPVHAAAIQSYKWDFDGDGTFDQTTNTTSGTSTATTTYANGGTRNAKVRITDADGDFVEKAVQVQVTDPPDLTVSSIHTDPFRVGTRSSYTLSARNLGAGPTTGTVTVTDTLPAGLSFASASGSGWSCGAVGQVVTCTRSSLAAGATAPAITVEVDPTTAAMPEVTNAVSVGTPNDASAANDSATDPTNVTAVDLAIDKSHVAEHFRLGAHANNSYEIEVTNTGSAPTFTPVTVTDTLPAGLTYVGATGAGWSCGAAGQDVTCTHAGAIAGGGASANTIDLDVSAALEPGDTAETVTNSASVSTTDDIDASDNSDSDPTLILDAPDLRVTKAHADNFVAGQQGEYTIGVRNDGPIATDDPTTVTDTLPAGLTYVGATGTDWDCSATGQDVTCTYDDPIAADSVAPDITLTVSVGGAAIPSVTNVANVANVDDPNPANDSTSDATLVRAIDLAVDKSHSATFRVDRNGTYEFDITNQGDSSTVGPITVTDPLPAGLTYVGATGAGWSCGAAGQDLTCTTSEVLDAAESAPQLEIEVAVAPSAAPSVSNTATVATEDDFNPANDSDTDVTPIVEQDAGIAIHRTGSFVSGGRGTYLISVDNFGTRPTTGDAVVTSTLPAGLGFVSASGEDWVCAETGGEVTCTRTDSIDPETPVPDISLRVDMLPGAAPSVTTAASVATPDDRNPENDTASDTATVTGSDLSVTSSHTGSFRVGAIGEYTLDVTNNGDGPTRGSTTVTDTLPGGLTYVDASGSGWACDGSGQVVTCERSADLDAGDAAPAIGLEVEVGPAAAPSVTNEVSVSTPNDTTSGNDSDSDPTDVLMVDLGIELDHADAFAVGQRGEYRIAVSNDGTHATVGTIRVTDTLPTGLVPLEVSGIGWTCSISGSLVSCTHAGPLAPGDEAPELTLTVDVGLAAADPTTNTATVATTDDGNPSNDSDSHQVAVAHDPDLELGLTARPSTGFRVGGEAVYVASVRNVGGSPTTEPATLTLALADGLSLDSESDADWACTAAGETVTCEHAAPFAPGERSDLELQISVGSTAGESLTTDGEVAVAGDQNPHNDSAQASSLTKRIDLQISRAHTGDWQAGQAGAFEVLVENRGSADTVGPIVVTDVLPAGVTYSSVDAEDWDCSASADTITCELESIAAGEVAPDISVSVDIGDAAAPSVNAVTTVATEDDADPSNDSASETIDVAERPREAPRSLAAEIVTKKVRATSSGLVSVFLRCPDEADTRCQGELALDSKAKLGKGAGRPKRALGSGGFDIATGRLGMVRVRLSKAHKSALRKLGKLKVKATATTVGLQPTSRKIVLKAGGG